MHSIAQIKIWTNSETSNSKIWSASWFFEKSKQRQTTYLYEFHKHMLCLELGRIFSCTVQRNVHFSLRFVKIASCRRRR